MWRRLSIALFCLLLVAAGAAAFAWHELLARIEAPHAGIPDGGVFVDVERGDSIARIASRLAAAGVVADEWLFRFAVRRSGRDRELQAGEYFFDAPLSPLAAVTKIADGRVHLRPITFPEGLTLSEMAAVVEAKGFSSAAAFAAAAARPALIADLDPDATDLEGYLFPETYSLPRRATADDLVAAMVAQFRRVFDEGLRARVTERGLSVREAVTLASVIQRETGSGAEHALVSAVFNNRLRIGMPLQSDPTVIYALERAGEYDGNLTRSNMQDRLAVQHLSLRGAAARPDLGAGARRAARRAGAGPTRPTSISSAATTAPTPSPTRCASTIATCANSRSSTSGTGGRAGRSLRRKTGRRRVRRWQLRRPGQVGRVDALHGFQPVEVPIRREYPADAAGLHGRCVKGIACRQVPVPQEEIERARRLPLRDRHDVRADGGHGVVDRASVVVTVDRRVAVEDLLQHLHTGHE